MMINLDPSAQCPSRTEQFGALGVFFKCLDHSVQLFFMLVRPLEAGPDRPAAGSTPHM